MNNKWWTPRDIIRWLPTVTGCNVPSNYCWWAQREHADVSQCDSWDFHTLIYRSCHIQHEAFFTSSLNDLTALFRALHRYLNVQTDWTWNPRHPYSTGNNQVFQSLTWHASFISLCEPHHILLSMALRFHLDDDLFWSDHISEKLDAPDLTFGSVSQAVALRDAHPFLLLFRTGFLWFSF